MSNYRNANLLYKGSLSVWTARKKDKSESVKVNSAAGAVDGAANVHKQLLPDSPELLAVQKWATGFRTWIYDTTLPWDDSGWRIGRTIRHMDFMAEAGDRISVGNSLVEDFIAKYEQAVEEAKFKLNGMFNHSDYPTVAEVRRKFSFTVDCMAMPDSEDFRVVDGVEQAEVDRLVQVATSSTEARIGEAMKEAYSRLYDVVSKMALTLTQYGNKDIKKFNNTLIGNISTLAAIMPALNLTDDPALAELTRQAERLTTYDLLDLRENEATRNAAIREASELAKKFAAIKGADEPSSGLDFVALADPEKRGELAEQKASEDRAQPHWPFPNDTNGVAQARMDAFRAEQDGLTGKSAIEQVEDEAEAERTPVNEVAALAGGWGE